MQSLKERAKRETKELISYAEGLRAIVLSTDFSFVETLEFPTEFPIHELPPSTFPQTTMIHQLLDSGRANSVIVNGNHSFFRDPYHREAFFNNNKFFSLAKESCDYFTVQTMSTTKFIPFSLTVIVIVYLFAWQKGYQIHTLNVAFSHLGLKDPLICNDKNLF